MYWRVCLINGLVLAGATLALALSPATVSQRPVASEAVVLGAGLAAMLVLNGLLLRSLLHPLDHVRRAMATADPRRRGQRIATGRWSPTRQLVTGFNAMLARLEEERSDSATRAIEAQEAERKRLAQELHDEVGQSLTAVLLSLGRAEGQAHAGRSPELAAARATTRACLDELRRISQRLRPGVLDDLGLLNALSSLASEHTATTGIPVRRGFAPGLPTLPSSTELVLYRVAQEALTNVARHADATTVELRVHRVGDLLVLHVEDDGRGYDGTRPGTGQQGMTERAQTVGGTFTIQPREGGGTCVSLSVPLPQDAP